MPEGEVIHICIRPDGAEYPTTLEKTEIREGVGLVGHVQASAHRLVTLIEESALEAVREELDVEFGLSDSRRNFVMRGVALNDLVGKEFMLGSARLKGTDLCHPCSDLEKKTHQGIVATLANRGGLCAAVITGGEVTVGDRLEIVE